MEAHEFDKTSLNFVDPVLEVQTLVLIGNGPGPWFIRWVVYFLTLCIVRFAYR